MKTEEILKYNNHRPFNCPTKPWTIYQEWNKAIFLHWEVDAEVIQEMLPKTLTVDIINGKAWVSIVAFDMNNVRLRYLPKPPYISDFQEINIRTYVVCSGKPSVYFFSMEANNKLSCKIIKQVSKFPYRYSKMNRDETSYHSKNTNLNEAFSVEYTLDNVHVVKDETDKWLTERYAVFQNYKNKIIEYDVHHIEWPMQNIICTSIVVDYPRFTFLNNIPDKIHYSSGVQVLTWDKKEHKK